MPGQVKSWYIRQQPKKLQTKHGHPYQMPEEPKKTGTVPWSGGRSRAWPIPSLSEPQFPHLYNVGVGKQRGVCGNQTGRAAAQCASTNSSQAVFPAPHPLGSSICHLSKGAPDCQVQSLLPPRSCHPQDHCPLLLPSGGPEVSHLQAQTMHPFLPPYPGYPSEMGRMQHVCLNRPHIQKNAPSWIWVNQPSDQISSLPPPA